MQESSFARNDLDIFTINEKNKILLDGGLIAGNNKNFIIDGIYEVFGNLWDTISRNFAAATEGEVVLLVEKRDDRNNTVKLINNIIFKKEEAA